MNFALLKPMSTPGIVQDWLDSAEPLKICSVAFVWAFVKGGNSIELIHVFYSSTFLMSFIKRNAQQPLVSCSHCVCKNLEFLVLQI